MCRRPEHGGTDVQARTASARLPTCAASEQAKRVALDKLGATAAAKVTLPFVEDHLAAAKRLVGEDLWPYGFGPNHHVFQRFLRRHHEEGLSSRLPQPEELFRPGALEMREILRRPPWVELERREGPPSHVPSRADDPRRGTRKRTECRTSR